MSDATEPPAPSVLDLPTAVAAPVAPWLMFAIVTTALFMVAMDLTIVATALPAIHRSLHASINWAGWTITIYGLSSVVMYPVAGKFSNELGRRRVFLLGVSVFTASSLICGFTTDIYMLIVFRALQALGGGAIQPSAAGLIADNFGDQRGRAISLFGVVAPTGQVVGPVAGGLLVGYLSWRWIFFVNVPIGVILVLLALRFVPISPKRPSTRTGFRGLLLMAGCVLAAIYGVTSLGTGNTAVDAPTFVVPEAIAAILFCFFVRHERKAESPFIPLGLLTGRGFAVMNVINLLRGTITLGIASLIPLYAEDRYHLTALSAGTLLTARALGTIALGTAAAFAIQRTGYRLPMMLGFTVIAIGTVLLSVAPRWGVSPFAWLSVSAGIAGLGLGAVNPAASNAGLQLAPDQVAAVTGLRAMFINLGVIVSVSVTTAILNRSDHPGIAQAHIFWVASALAVFVILPLIARAPEHRGTW